MNPYYDLHSWSRQCREERLAEASKRHLAERARVGREQREWGWLMLAWRNPLALLRGA